MADFYKILKADALGEPWTPSQAGAKPVQNYWCQVEGQDWAVSVGRQVDNPLAPGTHIYGDLTYAKSQKGTEYWKFKGQKVPDDVQRPADSPAQATAQQATGTFPGQPTANMSAQMPDWFIPVNNMILFIYKELRKMSDEPEQVTSIPGANYSGANKPQPKQTKPEVIGGAPLDEETKANLDNIFGDEPEVTPPEEV